MSPYSYGAKVGYIVMRQIELRDRFAVTGIWPQLFIATRNRDAHNVVADVRLQSGRRERAGSGFLGTGLAGTARFTFLRYRIGTCRLRRRIRAARFGILHILSVALV
jgi:hypothetical protein